MGEGHRRRGAWSEVIQCTKAQRLNSQRQSWPDRGAGRPEPPEPFSGVILPRLDSLHIHMAAEVLLEPPGRGGRPSPSPTRFLGCGIFGSLTAISPGLGSGDPGETPSPGSEVQDLKSMARVR